MLECRTPCTEPMGQTMLRYLLLAPALALAACAVPNSASNAVVVTDSKAVVERCTRLVEINGDSGVSHAILMDRARDSAMSRLKIRGAEAGGTHVLSDVAAHNWKGPSTQGTVYRC